MENKITYLGTILIARFMGYKFYDADKESYPFGYWQQEMEQEREEDNFKIADDEMIFELNYHADWRKIMPVIEKIVLLDYQINLLSYRKNGKNHNGISGGFTINEGAKIISFDENESIILATWNSIVDFIEWHNKNTAVTPKGID